MGPAAVGGAATGAGEARQRPGRLEVAARRAMTASTSARVIRPPRPVPGTSTGSMPWSASSLRTTGESTWPVGPARGGVGCHGRRWTRGARWRTTAARRQDAWRARAGAEAGGARGGRGAGGWRRCRGRGGRRGRSGRRRLRRSVRGRRRGPVPSSRRTRRRRSPPASTPTSTVSPSWTRISVSTPAAGDGHLGVDLVGRHLEERLVPGDLVADRLQPLGDGALGDRLAELGHRDVSQRAAPFR